MKRALELHDSCLGSAEVAGGEVVLRFDRAYVHQSDGEPGVDPGSGWVQTVEVRVADGVLSSPASEVPVNAYGGWLKAGDMRYDNCLPLPFRSSEAVQLRLKLNSGLDLTVVGTGISVAALGDPTYVEEFS